MLLNIFSSIVDGVVGIFSKSQDNKAAKEVRKDRVEEAKVNQKIRALDSDVIMDEGSRKFSGFMDDLSFYSVWVIVICAFIPATQPHILAGFGVIEKMPIWFQVVTGLMLASIWGYRKLVVPLIEKVLAAKLGKM